MSLIPVGGLPIDRVDTVVEVVRKGDGTHERDEAFVTMTLHLTADIDATQDVTLIAAISGKAAQQPLLRYIDDDVRAATAVQFDEVERSAADQRVVDDIEALGDGATKKELQRLAAGVRAASKGWSQTLFTVKPGERQLRFFFTVAAERVAEREFAFDLLVPLASFVVITRGTAGVVGILPPGTTPVEIRAWQDPNNPGSELPRQDATLAGRTCFGFSWTNDPLVRVRYRY
jgi:hypothetical protein